MAKITVNKISTDIVENYTEQDLKLIPSFDIVSQFNPETDIVEFSVYNEQNLLEGINYNYTDYTVTLDYNTKENSISSVNVDPEADLLEFGIDQGTYTLIYNFLKNQISSSVDNPYYIKEISSDRKELRIANNNIPNDLLEEIVNNFKTELGESVYFEDFEINLGNNNIFLANNILVDTTNDAQYTVLIKLYEPLPTQFGIKDTLRVILQTAEEVSYQVNFPAKEIPTPKFPSLRGPNFNLNTSDLTNNSTVYTDKQTLTKSDTSSDLFSGSIGQLKNILESKGITPNVDYSDFNNFVYFSSAEERVRNFYYKVGKIEEYTADLTDLDAVTGAQKSGSVAYYQTLIDNILTNFDEYERYQYYSSGSSDIYPKTNSTFPYTLASTSSADAESWLLDQATTSGSNYDLENPDRLVNSLPNYVKDDTRNNEFFSFMDMVGQHFDDIWVYTKDLGNRFDADNRLKYGISKDIVADAIKSMGVNLYQNNFSSDNLLSALIGVNPGGGTEIPTGSDFIETIVTASSDHSVLDDVNKEFYKRIFHNLPLLLKQKGSITGLRTLANTFGIPDSILRISEFGGMDTEDDANDNDYYQSKFTYAMYNSGSSVTSKFETEWALNSKWGAQSNRPETYAFRFKPDSLPTQDTYNLLTVGATAGAWYLSLEYTGSGYTSSSYSGSIPSESKFDARAILWDTNGDEVVHLTAPFYNGNWWSVAITKEGSSSPYNVALMAAESLHHGDDGYTTGQQAISTTTNAMLGWGCTKLFVPAANGNAISLNGDNHYGLTGSFQEIRFYNEPLTKFNLYNLAANPHQIVGANPTSSADNLVFRAPLGSELDTDTGTDLVSVHPKVTGSFTTSSFASDSNYTVGDDVVFVPNNDFFYYRQVPSGIKNRVKEKIRLESSSLAPHNPAFGNVNKNVLSPLRSIQQTNDLDSGSSYTNDINLLEVAFSPQNEINDDINNSFGYFNIGEYIGDPRHVSESTTSYQDLDYLQGIHFRKYYKNYNWTDYIRLIKFFDNSLFKMLQDFAPAKSSLASGVTIKQHILERNKQRPPIVEVTQSYYTGSINSGFAEGGQAGVYDALNFPTSSNEFINGVSPRVTQSWDYAVPTISGSVVVNQSTQDEFYNGELSGSKIITTNGELNPSLPLVSRLDPFNDNWDQFYNVFDAQILNWGNGGYGGFLRDVNNKKFRGIQFSINSGTGLVADKGPDYTYYFERLQPGDKIAMTLLADNIQSDYFPVKEFTITTAKFISFNLPDIGFQIGVEHDWEPEGPWLEFLNGGDNPVGARLIYDGSPLGPYSTILNYDENNVDYARRSIVYQDVDYSSNATLPVNYDLLRTNGAQRAQVQDSNYAQKTWRNSRYDGTRVSSVGFNIEIQR